MVADSGSNDAHPVHQSHLDIAFEHGVIGRALAEVATVEIEQVGVFPALVFQQLQPADESSPSRHVLIGKVLIERHDATVRVVGVQYHQFLILCLCGHRQGDPHQCDDNISSHSPIPPRLFFRLQHPPPIVRQRCAP